MKLLEQLDILPYTGTNGVYSAVIPVDRDRKILTIISEVLGIKVEDPSTLHVTLVYSKEGNVGKDFKFETNYYAFLKGVELWVDHKGRKLAVATFNSDDLHSEHKRLVKAGAEHSYPEFTPHVTLGKVHSDFELNSDDVEMVKAMVAQYQFCFVEPFIGDLS